MFRLFLFIIKNLPGAHDFAQENLSRFDMQVVALGNVRAMALHVLSRIFIVLLMCFNRLCQSLVRILALEPIAFARLRDPNDVSALAVHLHLGADVRLTAG
jgi:hypothetical protein